MILVCLLSFAAGPVKYTPLELHQMILGADRIVAGTIVELDDATYRLRVEDDLLESGATSDVRVRRFVNWTCAHRWKEYEVGERLVLFATNGTGPETFRLRVMSGGGEGEMPLHGESVTVMSMRGPGFVAVPHPRNPDVSCAAVPLAEMKEAIAAYRRCFVRDGPERFRAPILASGVDEPAIEALAAQSSLLRELCRHTFEYGRKTAMPEPKDARRDLAAISLADPPLPVQAQPSAWMRSRWISLDRLGAAIAFCGGADGDGVERIAIGAWQEERDNAGRTWEHLVATRRDGGVSAVHDLQLRGPDLHATQRDRDVIVPSLANVGDLDGDGIEDVAIGGRPWPGTPSTVRIAFLDRDRGVRQSVDLGAQPIVRDASRQVDGDIGWAVAHVGDLDGDGTVELAVLCARGIHSSARHRRVLLLSVDSKGLVRAVRPIEYPERPGDVTRAGEDLCGVGDVDGDGVSDLALSNPNGIGCVWIALLTRDGGVRELTRIGNGDGGFDGLLLGDAAFGSCLAPLGDLDRDGVVDLLVGSERHLWCLFLKRDGTVKSHRVIREVDGPFDIGRSVATRIDAASPSLVQVAASGERKTADGLFEPVIWRFAIDRDGKIVTE